MPNPDNPFEPKKSLLKMNIQDPKELETRIGALRSTPTETVQDLESFVEKWDELSDHAQNEESEAYYMSTRDVSVKENKERLDNFIQTIAPKMEVANNDLNNKFLDSPSLNQLDSKYEVILRNLKNERKLYRKENVDLRKKETKLSHSTSEIIGKLEVEWKGEKLTIPQLDLHLQSKDRVIREEAYKKYSAAKLSIADKIDDIFEQCFDLRQSIGKNAGFKNYRDYKFSSLRRFDYTPEDCQDYHNAVEKFWVPLRKDLMNRRKKNLGLDSLRPWDTTCDELGRDPLLIYDKNKPAELIDGADKVISSIDKELHGFYQILKNENLLDLMSRPNKAQGGYMTQFPVYQRAIIFSNGVGLGDDLVTLLHEAGHCFHYFLGKDLKPSALQDWTSEIAEVGSMAMECFGMEHIETFLAPEKATRVKEDWLERIARLFCGVAQIDAFQHWLYTQEKTTKVQRHAKYLELSERFSPGVNREGFEALTGVGYQFTHILEVPFYYIEYAISQIVALSLWNDMKEDPSKAIANYKRGCSLAASKPLPEIYKAFGVDFDFGPKVLEPLAKLITAELKL